MSGFSNPIIGGGGALVYPAIQSPNFVHGVSGWQIAKDGSAEFQDVIIPAGSGGATVTFGATAPGSPNTGDLWYDTANGLEVSQWNGSSWVAYQLGYQALSATAGILAAQVAFTATDIDGITTYVQDSEPAGSINAGSLWIDTSSGNALYQYDSGSWSLYQFGSGSIAENSISAAQMVANTITASQLAAGIVYAGIVDSTTITAATFDGGTYEGTDFIITTSGSFWYSGSPAANKLIMSFTTAGGYDPEGNICEAGLCLYYDDAGTYICMQLYQNEIQWYTAASQSAGWTPTGASVNVGTTGAIAVEGATAIIDGGSGGTVIQGAGGLTVDDGLTVDGALSVTPHASGYTGTPNLSGAADFTNYTVTEASFTQCSKAWSIPAGDAQAGTTYRLTVSGSGTQGSTARALTFQLSDGYAEAIISDTFAATSAGFSFKVVFEITVITTGSDGTANFSCVATAGKNGAGEVTAGFTQAGAFDTTSAFTFEAQAEWGATGGAPTMTSYQSFLERIGP